MSTPASAIPRHDDTRRSVIDQARTESKAGHDEVDDVGHVENAGDVNCDEVGDDDDVANVDDRRSAAEFDNKD